MATIKAYINFTVNDAQVVNFPFSFEQEVDEIQQLSPVQVPGDGDGDDTTFTALGIGEIDTTQFLFLHTLQDLGLRIEGGEATNVAIRIGAGGFILLGKVTLLDSNIKTNNNSTIVATVVGLAGGT